MNTLNTEFNLDQHYNECIEKLKAGSRPQIKLTIELIESLISEWDKALSNGNNENINKILCLLDNSQSTTKAFDTRLIDLLESGKGEILVFALSVVQKQTIAQSQKSGVMFDMRLLEALKSLLKIEDPELKEWTLRTIESLGPLSLRLKKEILEAKPSFLSLFNSHNKNSAQIIDFMQKDWLRMMGK